MVARSLRYVMCCSGGLSDVATGRLAVRLRVGVGRAGLGDGDRPLQPDRRDVVPALRRTTLEGQRRQLLRRLATCVAYRGRKCADTIGTVRGVDPMCFLG